MTAQKSKWLESTVSLMKDSENVDVIAKDFQEQAKMDFQAEIGGLESDLLRKRHAEKKAKDAYDKTAFAINKSNDITAYIRNRDSAYNDLQRAQADVKTFENTLKRRKEQLLELE